MFKRLRCIKIETMIQFLEFRMLNHIQTVERKMTSNIPSLIKILPVKRPGRQSLGTKEQHIITAEL